VVVHIALTSGIESRREESAVFLENLLQYLLDKVDCKDKTVRVRLCQLTVACINSLDELSDQLWSLFRAKMVERLFDKEPAVRAQAVHACARLQVTNCPSYP
jgi:condensin complex subunit 3